MVSELEEPPLLQLLPPTSELRGSRASEMGTRTGTESKSSTAERERGGGGGGGGATEKMKGGGRSEKREGLVCPYMARRERALKRVWVEERGYLWGVGRE